VLTPVPSLDELARDPAKAANLPPGVAAALLVRAAAVQSVLAARIASAEVAAPAPAPAAPADEMLTIDEAAALLRRSRRWLYRNADRLPFVKRVSRKSLLCSKARLMRWLAIQPAKGYGSMHANSKAGGFTHDDQNHHPFA
jgi:hypothetical protein